MCAIQAAHSTVAVPPKERMRDWMVHAVLGSAGPGDGDGDDGVSWRELESESESESQSLRPGPGQTTHRP